MIQLSEIAEIENRPARPVTRQQATSPDAHPPRRRLAKGTGAVSTVAAPLEWDEADLAAETPTAPGSPDSETLDR